MSVGYDLAGIRSAPVRAWIESMMDARAEVEALRREIPDDLRRWRDLDFTTRLSDQITLSTFHGCPATEIEGIVRFLLTEIGVHVTVKLNPTLLGQETVDGLLHDVLGYHEVRTRAEDFDQDLQWGQALEITDRLSELARSLGRTFQVKFSNTLVVRNHRAFFPASESVMYLSGGPLHVITMALVDKYRRAAARGADLVLGRAWTPRTTRTASPSASRRSRPAPTSCARRVRPPSALRRPPRAERMRAAGAPRIGDFVLRAFGKGEEAVRAEVAGGTRARRAPGRLGAGGDLREAADAGGPGLYDRLVRARRRPQHAPGCGARGRRAALSRGEEPGRSAQDRLPPRAVRLHQLRQVHPRLSQRCELRLRDGPAVRRPTSGSWCAAARR